jgi:hypothetical protein
MSVVIAGRKIERVRIVEDDPSNRESMSEVVADANFKPVLENGPLPDLKKFITNAIEDTDAFIFDHHLKQSQYAPFDGAQAVASLYKKCPSLLCTQWSKADIDGMRLYRRYVPVLIPTDKLDTDKVTEAITVCINEFNNKFLPSREPVQTILRIESVDFEQKPPIVYGVVPSWNPRQVIRFPISVIKNESLQQYVRPDARFFVHVNLGAEDEAELYFDGFDYRGK